MRKIYIFGLVGLAAVILGIAWAEQITLSTYYPAPYGVYKQLRLFPNDDNAPGAACTDEGEMYFDDSDSQLYYCDGSSNTWQAVGGGFWAATGDDIYNTNTDNVGIGTTTPNANAPDGFPGILDVQDVYLRSTAKWLSRAARIRSYRQFSGYTDKVDNTLKVIGSTTTDIENFQSVLTIKKADRVLVIWNLSGKAPQYGGAVGFRTELFIDGTKYHQVENSVEDNFHDTTVGVYVIREADIGTGQHTFEIRGETWTPNKFEFYQGAFVLLGF